MTDVDVAATPKLQQITVAAVARAAGRGLLTTAEAGQLIDRILTDPTTSPSTRNNSSSSGGQRLWSVPSDHDRSVR
jgi:hypothetical protein